jgi:TP901 family phage tail tape measure protein
VRAQAELDLAQWQRAQQQLQRDVARMGQTLSGLPTATPKIDTRGVMQGAGALNLLQAALGQVVPGSRQLDAAFDAISGTSLGMATALGAVIAGELAVAGAAIKSAAGLQTVVNSVRTIADIDPAETFSALNQMAVATGQTATVLGRSLYDVFGTLQNVTGEQALGLVEGFAKGAVAAQSDAASFGQAVMGVLNSYRLETEEASRVQDLFFNAVKLGSGTAKDYQTALGSLASAGRVAGASLEEVFAFMAVVSQTTGPPAEAFNNLQNVFSKLVSPETVERLRLFGITTTDLAGRPRPLIDVLGDLNAQVERLGGLDTAEAARMLGTLFPDMQARAGIVALLTNFQRTRETLEAMPASAGAAERAFHIMAEGAEHNGQRVQQAWTAALNELGITLLPAATAAAQGLVDAFRGAGEGLGAVGREFDAATTDFATDMARLGQATDGVLAQLQAPLNALVALAGIITGTAIPAWDALWAKMREGVQAVVGGGPQATTAELGEGVEGEVATGGEAARTQIMGLDWSTAGQVIGTQVGENLRASLLAMVGTLPGGPFLRAGLEAVGGAQAAQAQQAASAAEAQAALQAQQVQEFARLAELAQEAGLLAGVAYVQGWDASEIPVGTAQILDEQQAHIQATFGGVAALGIAGGTAFLDAWMAGIAQASPALAEQVRGLVAAAMAQLGSIAVPAGEEATGAAVGTAIIEQTLASLRTAFPALPATVEELIRGQLQASMVVSARAAGDAAGQATGEGMAQGIQQRVAEISGNIATVFKQLQTGGVSDKAALTLVNPEDIARLDAARRGSEEFGTAIKNLTDRDLAAHLQAMRNKAVIEEDDVALQQALAAAAAHYTAQQQTQASAGQAAAVAMQQQDFAAQQLAKNLDQLVTATFPGLTTAQQGHVLQLQAMADAESKAGNEAEATRLREEALRFAIEASGGSYEAARAAADGRGVALQRQVQLLGDQAQAEQRVTEALRQHAQAQEQLESAMVTARDTLDRSEVQAARTQVEAQRQRDESLDGLQRQAQENATAYAGEMAAIDQRLADSLRAAEAQAASAVQTAHTTIAQIQADTAQALTDLDKQFQATEADAAQAIAQRQAAFRQGVADLFREQANTARDSAAAVADALENVIRQQRDAVRQASAQAVQAAESARQALEGLNVQVDTLTGQILVETDASKVGDLALQRNRALAERARKEQELLAAAWAGRAAIDEADLEAQESIAKITRDAAKQAADQRAQIIQQLADLVEQEAEAQGEDARAAAERRQELDDRRADLLADAEGAIADALREQGRALADAAAAAAAAEATARREREEAGRRFDEQQRRTREARERLDREWERAQAERDRSRDEARQQYQRAVADAQRRHAEQLREIRRIYDALAGNTGEIQLNGNIVVQETAVDWLADVATRARERMRVGAG